MFQVCEIIGLEQDILNTIHRAKVILRLFIFRMLELFSLSNVIANSWSYAPDLVHDTELGLSKQLFYE